MLKLIGLFSIVAAAVIAAIGTCRKKPSRFRSSGDERVRPQKRPMRFSEY